MLNLPVCWSLCRPGGGHLPSNSTEAKVSWGYAEGVAAQLQGDVLKHILLEICIQSLSCIWLFATPRTLALQAPLSTKFFQAGIVEWVAFSSSRGSSPLWDWTHVSCISCIGRRVLYHECHLGSTEAAGAPSKVFGANLQQPASAPLSWGPTLAVRACRSAGRATHSAEVPGNQHFPGSSPQPMAGSSWPGSKSYTIAAIPGRVSASPAGWSLASSTPLISHLPYPASFPPGCSLGSSPRNITVIKNLVARSASECSVVPNSAIPGTIASQDPLSMEFSRQEYWSGLPFPTPGDLPNPAIKLTSHVPPALAGGFFTTASPGTASGGTQTKPINKNTSYVRQHPSEPHSSEHANLDQAGCSATALREASPGSRTLASSTAPHQGADHRSMPALRSSDLLGRELTKKDERRRRKKQRYPEVASWSYTKDENEFSGCKTISVSNST